MMNDIWAIMLKEWKEIFARRGNARVAILTTLIVPVGVLGIYLPLQFGSNWIGLPAAIASGIWLPQLMALGIVADSFAGERERHTLETLLSTRLSDWSILIGKLAAIIVYAVSLATISGAAGIITLSLKRLSMVDVGFMPILGVVSFSILMASLAAEVGVIISLYSSTVRQAQQTLGMVTLALTFGLLIGVGSIPESWRQSIVNWSESSSRNFQAAVVGGLILIINLVLFAVSRSLFRRNRLILD